MLASHTARHHRNVSQIYPADWLFRKLARTCDFASDGYLVGSFTICNEVSFVLH